MMDLLTNNISKKNRDIIYNSLYEKDELIEEWALNIRKDLRDILTKANEESVKGSKNFEKVLAKTEEGSVKVDQNFEKVLAKSEEGYVRVIQNFEKILTKKEEESIKINQDLKKLSTDIENIKHLLRASISPERLPKAVGDIRMQQQASLVMLKKFADFLKEEAVQYWLDFGTLLGAVRHQGFIPWDDDIDISMPRADYEKLKTVIGKFCKDGFSYSEGEIIRVFYKNTRAQIDVFPYDSGNSQPLPGNEEYRRVTRRLDELFRTLPFIKPLRYRQSVLPEEYKNQIPSINSKEILQGKAVPEKAYMYLAFHCFAFKRVLYRYEDIFPLREISFEGLIFNAPNRTEDYLHRYYGDFMTLPERCASRHPGMLRDITSDQMKTYQELIGLLEDNA